MCRFHQSEGERLTPPRLDEDEYSFGLYLTGSAHSVSSDQNVECEAVQRLREVVEEITGMPVEQQHKPRIGFLP